MSTSTLIHFPKHSGIEYQNAWGGAPYIWEAIWSAYGERDTNWMTRSEKLWPLAEDDRLEDFEKAVLVMTFDLAYIKSEDFLRAAKDLRDFVSRHGTWRADRNGIKTDRANGGVVVCHLPSWADAIEGADTRTEAIAFHGTSVSENPWLVYDEDKDDSDWIVPGEATGTYSVYDKLDEDADKAEEVKG